MYKFDTPNWDHDAVADSACKELFQDRKGKLLKKQKKNKRNLHSNAFKVKKIKNDIHQSEKYKKVKAKKSSVSANKLHTKSVNLGYNGEQPPKKKSTKNKKKIRDSSFQAKLEGQDIKEQHQHKPNEEGSEKRTREKKKKCKRRHNEKLNVSEEKSVNTPKVKISKIVTVQNGSKKKDKPIITLRQKMLEKLKAARFRYLNEQIYSAEGKDAQKLFNKDPDSFKAYHDGYRQQINTWPLNPLDVIIKSVQKMPKTHDVADFGCGEARLSKSVEQKVHSFDLMSLSDDVTACDMANVPLSNNSVDVVVFCLSLMGTNLHDYIREANRILKIGGLLKIAEVESRFDNIESFIQGIQHFGFKNSWKDLSHNLFYFLDFKKVNDVKKPGKLPTLSLYPCLYKRR